MITNIFVYFFQLILTNIVLSIILFSLFKRENSYKDIINLFVCFGISPPLTSLIIYYLLLFFPKNSSLFYILIIISIYTLLLFIARKKIIKTLFFIKKKLFSLNRLLLSIIFLLIFAWQVTVLKIPILGHDTFEYANQGKIFFANKSITYNKHQFDKNSNFYYVGRHGFIYPLFNTTERFVNDLFRTDKDFYFKSISGYYWILIVLLQFYLLSRVNKKLAILSTLTLVTAYGYAIMFAFFHLDTIRIFLLMLSIIFCLESIDNKNLNTLILFGITAGLASNIHSMGAFFSLILIFVFFVFQKNWKHKIFKSFFVLIIILIFGGLHYLLDSFIGTGWIF